MTSQDAGATTSSSLPNGSASNEEDDDIEEEPLLDDDSFTQNKEEDETTTTAFKTLNEELSGVPCGAWVCLVLTVIVVVGIVFVDLNHSNRNNNTPIPTQFLMTNEVPSQETAALFPTSSNVPCNTDEACSRIMDALSPVLPPESIAAFHNSNNDTTTSTNNSCQSSCRDWLRTGKDILIFADERIIQRFGMCMLFCSTDGGNWLSHDEWLGDLHECDWYNRIGIDPCNRNEEIEVIRLHDNNLQGVLPIEVAILTSLFELTVTSNMIHGSVPDYYDQLSELDTLCLAYNLMEGPIPEYVWEFPDMVYLDLGYNFFSGTLPDSISETSPNIQILFLENNQFNGTLPETIANLPLKGVHLDDNLFHGTIPTTLGTNASHLELQQLFLHGNNLNGTIPPQLGNYTAMTQMTFFDNPELGGDLFPNEICNLQGPGGSLFSIDQKGVVVDCVNFMVACDCCSCYEDL